VKQPILNHPGGSSKRRAAAAGSTDAASRAAGNAARDSAIVAAASSYDTSDDARMEYAVRTAVRGASSVPADSDGAVRQAAARHARAARIIAAVVVPGGGQKQLDENWLAALARKNGSARFAST